MSGPSIPVLLGWTVRKTDTLLDTHPIEFPGLSKALLRSSRVPS